MELDTTLPMPARIGPYFTHVRLHSGKAIFLASDAKTGEQVVIKKSRPHRKDNDLGEQLLLYEAELQYKCRHPNVVQLKELMRHDGELYIVTKYSGRNLREQGELPIEKKLTVLDQLAQALLHCHKQGVIHMDVKRENVLLNGTTRLADFDASRPIKEDHPYFEQGLVVGTPSSLAPEYWQKGEFSTRTDVFQYSLLAYQLLFNQEPFGMYEWDGDDWIAYDKPQYKAAKFNAHGQFGGHIYFGLSENPDNRPEMEDIARTIKEQAAKLHRQQSAKTSKPYPDPSRAGRYPRIEPEQHIKASYESDQQPQQAHLS